MHWKARLPLLAVALWWGSLTAIGFMAVPLLFSHAPSAFIAGNLAGRLFSAQTWLSLACGIVTLMGARDPDGTPHMDWGHGALGYLLVGMLAALLQEFAVAPHIVAREDLAFWHSAGTFLYGAQWLCALVVLWKLTSAGSRPREGGDEESHPRAGGDPGLDPRDAADPGVTRPS